MRLSIRRNQTSGVLGGVKFELQGKVQLTDAEMALVKKYKVEKEVLLKKEGLRIPFTGRVIVINLTIGSLINGQTFKCEDISEIMEYEKNLKESCSACKQYLEIMRTFGGEEIVEFPDLAESANAASAS